jgi:H+-translocating NAD(P) transhydrogenase subunit alpha
MKPSVLSLSSIVFVLFLFCPFAVADEPSTTTVPTTNSPATSQPIETAHESSRSLVLVASLTVFVLAIFVGFEIIAKVPPTLHTPLMSGSNAISGITVVGAIIAAGTKSFGVGSFLGMIAIVLAMINVVGGFLVTHRMLLMFKKR